MIVGEMGKWWSPVYFLLFLQPYVPSKDKFHYSTLSKLLVMTQEAFVDSKDQNQTAQNVQSDL